MSDIKYFSDEFNESDNYDFVVKEHKEQKVKKFTDLSTIDIKAKAFFVLCKTRKTLKLNKYDFSALNILINKVASDAEFIGSNYEDYVSKFKKLVYYKEQDMFDFEFNYEKN